MEKRSALNLAEAINAKNTLAALDFWVDSQEPGALLALFQSLSRCPALEYLFLHIKEKNTLTDSDVESLAHVIQNCTSLTVLDLSNMQLSADQQLKILQACSQSKSIIKIYFSYCYIHPSVIPALGHLLETSPTLRKLHLHDNRITPSELSILLKCLARNKTPMLEELNLGHNPIGAIGLAALATYIRSGKISIKNLDLGFTGLDQNCADTLLEIINCNSELESFSCDNNELDDGSLKKIAAAIQNNSHLITLDLHGNAFHGNQQLAAVPNMSDVPQSNKQLFTNIELKLSSNKHNHENKTLQQRL